MTDKSKNKQQEKQIESGKTHGKRDNPTNVQVNNDNGRTTSTGPRTPLKDKKSE
ncbi:hypothetical protein ACX0MV_15585 [Pseudomonas borbori]